MAGRTCFGRSFSLFCVTCWHRCISSRTRCRQFVTHGSERSDRDRLQFPRNRVIHRFRTELSKWHRGVSGKYGGSSLILALTKKSAMAQEMTGQQSFSCHTKTPAVCMHVELCHKHKTNHTIATYELFALAAPLAPPGPVR